MSIAEHQPRLIRACQTAMSPHYQYLYNAGVSNRELTVIVYNETKELTHFSISWLPGNPKVVIFHDVVVDPTERGKGLGDLFHKVRIAIGHEFGATTALCTTRVANSVENRILKNNGWTILFSVTDDVLMWSRQLGNRGQ